MTDNRKKMSQQGGAPPSGGRDDTLIRPDTFWELIEKLLLNKTRDEQSRRRQNAALSALCRGHALPRVPRKSKLKSDRPNKYTTAKTMSNDKLSIPNSVREKQTVIAATIHSADGAQNTQENLQQRRSKSVNEKEMPTGAKEVKSECMLNDLDIVYVKESSAPASERLWRYAIKNRKRSEAKDRDYVNSSKLIPCIRSNEAIYLGLRKRMEETLKEQKQNEKQIKEVSIKRRHSCEHIQKIRSDVQVNDRRKAVPKVKRTPSYQNQPATADTNRIFRQPLKSTRSVLTMQENLAKIKTLTDNGLIEAGIRKWQSREQLFSPWGNDNPWSDLAKIMTVKSKERFDTKKALYNSVIKRRLNCGSQLDSLNKEIISKRDSPRTVLSKETTRKYAELKNEYLNLCYLESTLRHQISLLHAEIYMMQNKGFHRTPATIKTITFDAQTTPLHRNHSLPDHVTECGAVQMFPSLKAPRPLITLLQKQSAEKQPEISERAKRLVPRTDRNPESVEMRQASFPNVNGGGTRPHGICSIYSISPQMVSKQREPFTLCEHKAEKLTHRLPRMTFSVDTPPAVYSKF